MFILSGWISASQCWPQRFLFLETISNCDDLDEYVKYFGAEQCASVLYDVLLSDSVFCGCATAKPAFSMCDGPLSYPELQVPTKLFNKAPTTCRVLAAYSEVLISAGIGTCDSDIQVFAGYCGCNGAQQAGEGLYLLPRRQLSSRPISRNSPPEGSLRRSDKIRFIFH
jgi:hypothetical protein